VAQWTDAQLATLAGKHWSGRDRIVAVAVALAESGGRTDARGDEDITTGKWGPSIGLWQIRSLNADKGTGKTRDEVANLDPTTNAAHAFAIWQDENWSPWTTYTWGKYLVYWPRAAKAVAGQAVDLPDPGDVADAVVPDAASAILDVAREPLRFLEWLKQPINVERIGQVLVGGVILVVGLAIVAYGTTLGSLAASTGAKQGKQILKGK
jgi:hypothetical protein